MCESGGEGTDDDNEDVHRSVTMLRAKNFGFGQATQGTQKKRIGKEAFPHAGVEIKKKGTRGGRENVSINCGSHS